MHKAKPDKGQQDFFVQEYKNNLSAELQQLDPLLEWSPCLYKHLGDLSTHREGAGLDARHRHELVSWVRDYIDAVC